MASLPLDANVLFMTVMATGCRSSAAADPGGSAVAREARFLARRALELRVVDDPRGEHGADRAGSASATRPPSVEPVASFTRPTRYGPTKPPRLPIELISAIPAAAAVPLSSAAGIAQNTRVRAEQEEQADGERGDRGDRRDDVLTANATAASARQRPRARLRSPVRSECREISDQADDRDRVGDRGDEALADLAQPADLVDDLADPERQAVDVDDHAEVQEAEGEHAAVL